MAEAYNRVRPFRLRMSSLVAVSMLLVLGGFWSQAEAASATVTYQSGQLSAALGLPHLWIAFSGYWPEQGAALETTTFKHL